MSPIHFVPRESASAEPAFHDAAAIFDLLDGSEFDELVKDIRSNGLKLPIVLTDGKILDGRNRYRACKAAGVEPVFRQWDGVGSPSDFVWSLNSTRRHLDGNARALSAARYKISLEAEAKTRQVSGLKRGAAKSPSTPNGAHGKPQSTSQAASEKFDLPSRTVDRAAKVVKDGTPELQKAVAEDRISISAAAEVAAEAPDVQRDIANHPEIKKAVKALKDAKALKDEADAMPKAEPLTAEQKAEHTRIFGTQEDRAALMDVLAVTKLVTKLPAPAEMVHAVPPALEHAVDPVALLTVADWFEKFARAWEAKGVSA